MMFFIYPGQAKISHHTRGLIKRLSCLITLIFGIISLFNTTTLSSFTDGLIPLVKIIPTESPTDHVRRYNSRR